MTGIIADANLDGHLVRLMNLIESGEWAELWAGLGLTAEPFRTLGVTTDTVDRIVWDRCQAAGYVLLTANRNGDGEDSLDSVIRAGGPSALPVFTIADAGRVMTDSDYARHVIVQMLDYLIDLNEQPELLLGAGRLYLPKTPFTL